MLACWQSKSRKEGEGWGSGVQKSWPGMGWHPEHIPRHLSLRGGENPPEWGGDGIHLISQRSRRWGHLRGRKMDQRFEQSESVKQPCHKIVWVYLKNIVMPPSGIWVWSSEICITSSSPVCFHFPCPSLESLTQRQFLPFFTPCDDRQ